MDKSILLKRLSIVKLLYKRSLELSRQGESTAFLSILGFHDAIDMYLNIAVQHQNLKPDKGKTFLKDYLMLVPNLKHIQSILKLNENRNNIKHNASTLHNLEVESARVHTTEFFNDNTKQVFDIEFDDISLIELVTFNKTKDFLIKSQSFLNKNDIYQSVACGCIAFDTLIDEYKSTKRSGWNPAGFDFIKNVGSPFDFRGDRDDRLMETIIKTINSNFQNVNQALQILALGIDYRKFSKFRAIVPNRFYYDSDTNQFISTSYKEKKWIKENCEFIMDFVIESALILQEMNFDFMELQNHDREDGVSTI